MYKQNSGADLGGGSVVPPPLKCKRYKKGKVGGKFWSQSNLEIEKIDESRGAQNMGPSFPKAWISPGILK